MQQHDVVSLDCEIVETREYDAPGGLWSYLGYICKPATSDITYMVVQRTSGSVSDTMLYRCDKGMDVREAAQSVLTPDGQDFLPSYTVVLQDTGGSPHDVVWDKKSHGTTFGVAYRDEEVQGIRTVCEFQTASECGGESHAFVDWSGDHLSGWVEFWVGCGITPAEAVFTAAGKPF